METNSGPRPDFDELNRFRISLEERLASAVPTLRRYADDETGGFFHRLSGQTPGEPSKASTATCVAFLVASGRWNRPESIWSTKAGQLARTLVEGDWSSAGLEDGNAFTASFMLEAIHDLTVGLGGQLPEELKATIDGRVSDLRALLIANSGGIAIDDYPPTSFLTQKVVRVLKKWNALDAEAAAQARNFAWSRLFEESIVISAGRQDADAFELAYAALTASLTTGLVDMSPRQRDALRYCVNQFFAQQSESGTWPRSRPLFRYPKLGNAYCYDFELLVQMLGDPQLEGLLEDKLQYFWRSFELVQRTAIAIGEDGEAGWASGHLKPDEAAPESWTTASVYHYCHELRRFTVDAIRRETFAYAKAPYVAPRATARSHKVDPSRFLDSEIPPQPGEHNGLSLRRVIEEGLLRPLIDSIDDVERGHGLPRTVPNSAILYGPPGTSKTQLAEIVAEALGWPLLKLDPSHLTRDGLDRLHAETNRLFTMLAACERMVVLLDEFDELVLDRDQANAESSSRFLTTAMLPKIAELASRRRIVYILATNHIERFDDAISRAGRFDRVLPVMPPSLGEKYRQWPETHDNIVRIANGEEAVDETTVDVLSDLTYLEFQEIAKSLSMAANHRELTAVVQASASRATLRKKIGGEETWKIRVLGQSHRNRLGTT